MAAYHDQEWGVPQHDDSRLFELLVLEGAQAGLSWRTILTRRDGYRRAFAGFDPREVAGWGEEQAARLLADPGIVRNRAKIAAALAAARLFVEIQDQHGSFAHYLWSYVGHQPVRNHWQTQGEVPVTTPLAVKISADLAKRGFRFVGPTIIYSFLQATGVVNDHLVGCFRYAELAGGVDV